MAKGSSHPAGVRCFGYKQQSTKGKNHPDSVNAGQSAVATYEGQHPAITLTKGGSGSIPGVKQHSGKEHFTNVRHLNASHGGPKKASGADARPEGVRVFKDASV